MEEIKNCKWNPWECLKSIGIVTIWKTNSETIAETSLVEAIKTGSSPREMSFEERFVKWDVRAPLEVIYEDYEGEEALDRGIERYTSLSRRYSEPEPDSLFSEMEFPVIREWVSSEKRCCRWEEEEEEDREGLIEIALDFHGEEDNLIEIDISSIKV
ncbi:hypothetical protein J1N35_018405 [Gossypium stocksii]|uniref:Uncharacterized protein n=1 Tax=Gossypium stocksii TaxID=47602 RepID=A0A9D4A6M9_9ROSI|nr:hypothetical protein J1N35_018405 [Gossypium stocksii]